MRVKVSHARGLLLHSLRTLLDFLYAFIHGQHVSLPILTPILSDLAYTESGHSASISGEKGVSVLSSTVT